MEDDALTALEKLQGHVLHGRKLKLESGVKKDRNAKKDVVENVAITDGVVADTANKTVKQSENAVRSPKVVVAAVEVTNSANDDVSKSAAEVTTETHESIKKSRQILVFGVPVDVNKKAFKMAISKISKKAEVELIKEVPHLDRCNHSHSLTH